VPLATRLADSREPESWEEILDRTSFPLAGLTGHKEKIMKKTRYSFIVAAVAVALMVPGNVTGAGSAAAFHARNASEASAIGYNGYYLWNADTSNWIEVAADLGVSSATSMTVHVRGNTQFCDTPYYTYCSIYARGLNNASNSQGPYANTFNATCPFYTLTVSISGLPSGQSYAFELVCGVGPIASGRPGEQIWAWY
jgi:hypothetical protein